jgi:DNA-3-methyladenine glycosylase II
VQEAVCVGLGLPYRPASGTLIEIARDWRPLRGAAAHLWWAFYHVLP